MDYGREVNTLSALVLMFQIVFIILAVFGFASAAKHIDELEAESSTDMDKQNKNSQLQ